MEQILLDILVQVIAGILVSLIARHLPQAMKIAAADRLQRRFRRHKP